MAKVKVRREGNLLWEDECQPLTQEQMTNIKSQFHPSNTANVNIVPYEIYDEDGEEQRVGEVRKTIDGVKKRKPYYRTIILSPVINTPLISDVDELKDFRLLRQSSTDPQFYYVNTPAQGNVIADGALYPVLENNSVSIQKWGRDTTYGNLHFALVEYTKTTDQWQPI